MRLLFDSYWTSDPNALDFILFMLAVALAGVLFVFGPLQWHLWKLARLREKAGMASDAATGREAKQAAVGTVLKNSLLSGQWAEFVQRWGGAQGDVLHDRAPVRFADELRSRGLLPQFWGLPLLPAIPGILLGLGILGTFLGLTQALPHAGTSFVSEPTRANGAASTDRHDVQTGTQQRIDQQIDGMTQALALAFKTSLWGLTLSMFLTLWVRRLEGGYSREEHELDQVVHTAFAWVGPDELRALALHKQSEALGVLRSEFSTLSVELANVLGEGLERARSSAAESAETARREQTEALGRIAADLASILDRGLANIARSSADAASLVTNEQRAALAEIVTEIGDRLREGVGEQVSALVEAVESARRSQAEVTGAIERSLGLIEESTARHAELLAKIDATAETLGAVAEKTIGGAREVEPVIVRLTEAGVALREAATAAIAVQEASREGMSSLRQVLEDSRVIVEEQRRLAESSMGEMQSALRTMSEGLGDSLLRALREVDGVLAKAVQRVAGTTAETGEILERLGEPLAALNERFAAVSESVGTIGQAVEHLGAELGERLRSVNDTLERTGERVAAVSDVLGDGLESRLGPTRDALVDASRVMQASVARLVPELEGKVVALKQALEQGAERVSSGADSIGAEVAKVYSLLVELQRTRPGDRRRVLDGERIVEGDGARREVIEAGEVGARSSAAGSSATCDTEGEAPRDEAAPGSALNTLDGAASAAVGPTPSGPMPSTEAPGERQPRFLLGILRSRR